MLVNVGDNAITVSSHMRQKNHKYDPLNEVYQDWLNLSTMTNGQLEVRATEIPLLHRTYSVYSTSDSSYGAVYSAFYAYGDYVPCYDIRYIYTLDKLEALILRKEFDYLWNECCKE